MSSDEEKVPYSIPQRSTRGRRLGELDGEALEADEEFWGQSAWKELSDDEDIESDDWSSDEKEDQVDSDFDHVDEDAEMKERAQAVLEAEKNEKKRLRNDRNKKRNGVYVDPALRTTSKRHKTVNKTTRSKPNNFGGVIPGNKRVVRSSTKASTISTNSALNQKNKTNKSTVAPSRRPEPLVRLTQRQLLEEAARTELENKHSLEIMLMLQQENKRERTKAEQKQLPRTIYFSSSKGIRRDSEGNPTEPIRHSLTFTNVSRVPSIINSTAPPIPEKPTCNVTGLLAKYRDPKTGTPYRTVEAFKVLRQSAET